MNISKPYRRILEYLTKNNKRKKVLIASNRWLEELNANRIQELTEKGIELCKLNNEKTKLKQSV